MLLDTQTIPKISRFRQSTIHQGRIERILIDKMTTLSSSSVDTGIRKPPVTVERAVCPDMITLPSPSSSALSNDAQDRIVVRLRHLTEAEATPAQFSPMATDALYRSNVFEDDAMDAAPTGLPDKEVLEEVRARYVIGADGARSWTRSAIGSKLEGEHSDAFWGVVDGIPASDL